MWIVVNPATSKQGLKRDFNRVANVLVARRNKHSAAWLGQASVCVLELGSHQCRL